MPAAVSSASARQPEPFAVGAEHSRHDFERLVRHGQQLLERDKFHLEFTCGGFADIGIVTKHAHIESFGANGDFTP